MPKLTLVTKLKIDATGAGNACDFVLEGSCRGHYRKLLTGVSLLALTTALAAPPRTAKADTIAPVTALTGTVNGGGTGGFMLLNGATMAVTGATVSNFTAVGGNGSGGGAGLGGAVFVGTGSSLTISNSTFTNNLA